MSQIIFWFEIAGTVVFALSGAMAAARKNLDIFGFLVVALAPAIGGGTLRDLFLGQTPVFWVEQNVFLYVCFGAAIFTFFWAHKVASRFTLLVWCDAFGLALFATLGTERALQAGTSDLVAVIMGTLTAIAGGIIRDVICGEIPLILRKEIYALAAIFGSSVYLLSWKLLEAPSLALVMGFVATIAIRGAAIKYGWRMPIYKRTIS
ncbi:MAG: trimeric intracellular cation channel family protein [Alphaproteobacteria bacterium]|jgi:uncharacterized membrane protein YeiH|nr:trimeric intracellular cation channel family protein [Alphaproteobacteria bacterium]MBT4082686.1 trimeric intracellular cation channel family protein [Alphaproteobacteria bacterium]MBT4543652.1 trimeric intracellular cation channel family protein [Alphaproteobacteria bacterium]MBT7744420.1 trimeric intracellular cation channel family protein [Alphaproteobacteria bacterium]